MSCRSVGATSTHQWCDSPCGHHAVRHLPLTTQVDALISSLSIEKAMGRVLKWWRKGLYWVMDQMVTNSNVLYNELHNSGEDTRPLSRRRFVIAMLEGLEQAQQERRLRQQRVVSSPPPSAHAPILKDTAKRCWVCWADGVDHRTKTSCHHPDCADRLRLCHKQMSWGKRNCFERYHKTPHKYGVQKPRRRASTSPPQRQERRVRRRLA